MKAADKPASTVALLSAGRDQHYALGLLGALVEQGIRVDFVGNDEMARDASARHPLVNYFNLRGDQSIGASFFQRASRLSRYYLKLIGYAASAKPKTFHILWHNKYEWFDSTLLFLYYRVLGKRIVYTAHNVNTRERDERSGWLDRWCLHFFYRRVDRIFVHTDLMKRELVEGYGVDPEKATVVPFPVNNVTPRCPLGKSEARRRLGLDESEKIVLFFGNIAAYKGLECAVEALAELRRSWPEPVRLLIAGRVKNDPAYWTRVRDLWQSLGLSGQVTTRGETEYIPEEEAGAYFRAADVLVLPYRKIYQSGVIFLSYNQGLPVIASDVGALKESVVEGETGFVFKSEDAMDLAEKLKMYFESPLFRELEERRASIVEFVNREHSWEKVARAAVEAYRGVGL